MYKAPDADELAPEHDDLVMRFGCIVPGTGRRAWFSSLTEVTGALDRTLVELANSQGANAGGDAGGTYSAFVTIGVDGYAVINDAFGHASADMLLRRVAQALQTLPTQLRAFGLIGTAEFGAIPEERWHDESEARTACLSLAAELARALEAMLLLDDGVEIRVVTSCGFFIIAPDCKLLSEEIMTSAEIARKHVLNENLHPRVKEFEPQMLQEIQDRVALISGLRKGLPGGELELYTQPVVNRHREVISCEALIRWNSPTRGLVPPDEFIPLTEQTGMIIEIGHWVLEEACRTLASWNSDDALRKLRMSINVSARQLEDEGFTDAVLSMIAKYRVAPERLLLEVTEGMLHRDAESTISVIEKLSEAGVRSSLDDFGTGYSSLSYLQRLPVSQVKIDRSFVWAIGTKDSNLEIIKMIVQLAKVLKLEVVAEGVETEEQFAALSALEIDRYQGWLFGRPVPIAEFESKYA